MEIEINCPECGYNSYLVIENTSNTSVEAVISKCPDGGCDLTINNDYYEHYQDFDELKSFFTSRYTVTEITGTDCV